MSGGGNGESRRIRTAGVWDPDEAPVYFLAANTSRVEDAVLVYDWVLVAVNELENQTAIELFEKWVDEGKRVLLDSGIFWLATSHAKAHGMTMDAALGLAPEKLDGFEPLFKRYVHLCKRYGDKVWGYIELDQGGKENKRKTRARLHDLGLRPMPVYHPLNDGWDYFDELADSHERICCGNVVQASVPVRIRLLTTFWQRRRAYPHLWIHALGWTPNEWSLAVPTQSADSSTWMQTLRWPTGIPIRSAGKTVGRLSRRFQPVMIDNMPGATSDPEHRRNLRHAENGHCKGCRMSAVSAMSERVNWMQALEERRRYGIEV